jgi:hypothetical protein
MRSALCPARGSLRLPSPPAGRLSARNVAKEVRHVYVFNGGLLYCENCKKQMEGRSGTSRLKRPYFYYF